MVDRKKKWKNDPWVPDESWSEVIPEDCGNDVNGVGEKAQRRPTKIFWHRNPKGESFAEVQRHVTARFNSQEQLDTVYRNADRGPRRPPEIAAEPVIRTAEEWSTLVKAFCQGDSDFHPEGHPGEEATAELVGFTRMNNNWIYEGSKALGKNLIMIGTVMNHERLMMLPGDDEQVEGQLEVADQYNRGARVANWLTGWIRSQGYFAKTHAGPWVGSLNMVPAALEAGFGELGSHGSIINPVYGSSLRLAAVETDIPLFYDAPTRFGADEFCMRCQVCVNACPPQAIVHEKDWVRGDYKWYVNFDKCIPYFNETYSCGICVAVCPWSTPERAPKLAKLWRTRIVEPAA
ncbi:MAG: 4Fe-4S dicluster domain-containing protein [Pseudomonadales bacterium]